jgi:hypothetical protein
MNLPGNQRRFEPDLRVNYPVFRAPLTPGAPLKGAKPLKYADFRRQAPGTVDPGSSKTSI